MRASEIEAIACWEIGTVEKPVNEVKYNTWYYGRRVNGDSYPWCMTFVQWCFDQAGYPLPCRTASCGVLMSYAKKQGRWVTGPYRRGDVIIMQTDYGRHTGIVLDGDYRGTIRTVEGNTSDRSAGNGGEVMLRNRIFNIHGAYRPEYEDEVENMTEKELRAIIDDEVDKIGKRVELQEPSDWSKDARAWAEEKGLIVGDGKKMRYKSPVTREELTSILYRNR